MRLSDGEQQRMEQRLALRFAAIGDGAQSWLERQLSALSPDCALLTRWCYSASPVSDWANYEFSLFRACAEHALRLREQSPLARELPEPLFLNYVLHPRVNEEELCDCRGFFYAQLRGRIEGLSAREAILAINEWNAEQVCYRATDERTISALGAWRSGFGRCGEESTFAVNVLRAAGIPARQVYTPRWAHCDDNHAWVEAYCGGKHPGIYGLGHWRESEDARGNVLIESSPGWAGTYPWIDRGRGLYAVLVAHKNQIRLNAMYAGSALPRLVGKIVDSTR